MKKVFSLLLLILSLLNTSCTNRHFSTYDVLGYETIARLCNKVNSKEEALSYFNEWLTQETDYNAKDNGIDTIEKYKGYYEIKLKTSIIINGRTSGYMGYRDYVVTKDGYLRGYYYSK